MCAPAKISNHKHKSLLSSPVNLNDEISARTLILNSWKGNGTKLFIFFASGVFSQLRPVIVMVVSGVVECPPTLGLNCKSYISNVRYEVRNAKCEMLRAKFDDFLKQ